MSLKPQQQESWREEKEDILDMVDPKVPYPHFIRVLEKYTQQVISTERQKLTMQHAMEMAGLQAQIEQKAIIRASELVDEVKTKERQRVLEDVEQGLSMLTRYFRSIYRLDHSDGEPPQQMLLEDDVESVLNQLKVRE